MKKSPFEQEVKLDTKLNAECTCCSPAGSGQNCNPSDGGFVFG